MTEVIMPKMGDGMEEGTLVEWLKKDGDPVKADEAIANIQTDKAIVEIPAPAAGIMGGIIAQVDQTVPVGQPIAAILKPGESLPAGWGNGKASDPAPAVTEPTPAPASSHVAPAPTPVAEGRVKASPLAKKVATALGVEIAAVHGSGPGGRVLERDVRAHQPGSTKAAPKQGEVRELSRLRKVIAERTQAAKRDAPHFYVTVQVDVEALLTLRAQMNEFDPDHKVSINDFVMKASALALTEMPEANSNYVGDKWTVSGEVNIGMAVATEAGLLVPVVKNCQDKSLRAISRATKDLAIKARDGKLTLDEMSGSTFSVSNMGMLDVDNFIAILNTPNAAIVAVSSVRPVAAVMEDGSIAARQCMNLTGSFDHRVLDGAMGARVMNLVRDGLEHPITLLE